MTVGETVVSDHMPIGMNPRKKRLILPSVAPDHEAGRRDVLPAKDLENPRGDRFIGTVIERESYRGPGQSRAMMHHAPEEHAARIRDAMQNDDTEGQDAEEDQ